MEEMTAPDYAITLNNAPNYDGYIFKGYSLLTETEVTVPDDHIIYLNDLEYMNDSPGHIRLSMKLHYSIDPEYTGLQNTVTYAPNNASLPVSGSAPADPNLYSLGTPFLVMGQGTLAIDGYEFIGWNTKADGSGTMYHENDMAPMTEDGILYAQWKPEGSVLVSMNGNGGAFGSETSKELYMIPNTAFADAEGYEEPTREGYDFNGWASTPNAADADITAVPSTDNTTVYAVWARKTDVKVTFDALNGSNPIEETGAFEASLTVPADPTRTGYSFGGWNTKADGTGNALPGPAVFPGNDTTYYAQWIPNEDENPGVKAFVSRLYTVCLGRTPGDDEVGYYLSEIIDNGMTGSEVAGRFIFSDEFCMKNYCDRHYVEALYKTFMGRVPGEDETAYWTWQLQQGKTREEVFNSFVSSAEFASFCTEAGIDAGGAIKFDGKGTRSGGRCTVDGCKSADGLDRFVKRLYNVTLDRDPAQDELDAWVYFLIHGDHTARTASHEFLFSEEFISRGYTDEVFVDYLYRAMMGRTPGADEVGYWVWRFSTGVTREDAFNEFADSDEFALLCQDYGINCR